MIRSIEALGDRMLAVLVPRVTATADPGCDCNYVGSRTVVCWCECTPGSGRGTPVTETIWCDGCRSSSTGCSRNTAPGAPACYCT